LLEIPIKHKNVIHCSNAAFLGIKTAPREPLQGLVIPQRVGHVKVAFFGALAVLIGLSVLSVATWHRMDFREAQKNP